MRYFKIVLAKDKATGKVRNFMERNNNGVITHHNYVRIIRKWGRKYGCYHSIKREAGEAHFFNVGCLAYDVEIIKDIENVDAKSVGCGYSSVDKGK